MTLAELKTVLSGTGLPVAYLAFPADDPPAMPFVVYQEIGSDNFGADNKVWVSHMRIQIDLLCQSKNRITEGLVENALDNADIYWERESSFDDEEDYYRTMYYVEI